MNPGTATVRGRVADRRIHCCVVAQLWLHKVLLRCCLRQRVRDIRQSKGETTWWFYNLQVQWQCSCSTRIPSADFRNLVQTVRVLNQVCTISCTPQPFHSFSCSYSRRGHDLPLCAVVRDVTNTHQCYIVVWIQAGLIIVCSDTSCNWEKDQSEQGETYEGINWKGCENANVQDCAAIQLSTSLRVDRHHSDLD